MEAMDSVGCDWLLNDLGPPPDAILQIPPPPFPHFIDRNYLHEMTVAGIGDFNKENDTRPCHWCHWARRLDLVGSINVASGTGIVYILLYKIGFYYMKVPYHNIT